MIKNAANCKNPKRACIKLLAVVLVAALLLGSLIGVVESNALAELKHNFSVWTIVALVLIINLVSFLSFIVMYMAWRWVRSDLKDNADKEELDEEL